MNEPDAAARQRYLSDKAWRYAAQHPAGDMPRRPGLLERLRSLCTRH